MSKAAALWGAFVPALLLSVIVSDVTALPFYSILIPAWVLFGVGVMVFLRWAAERGRTVKDPSEGLTVDEARRQCFGLLADESRFRVVPAESGWTAPWALPASVAEVLGTFEEVAAVETPLKIGRAETGPCEINSTYLRVGRETDHTVVVVREGHEGCWILADDVPAADQIEESFPTLFHLVVSRGHPLEK
jgi:hypothetical protein